MWQTYTFGDNSCTAATVIESFPSVIAPVQEKAKRPVDADKWDSSSDSTVIIDTPRQVQL